jgi:hypothetical protein
LPCGDKDCREGGHDLTEAVLRGLSNGQAEFSVEDQCLGNVRGVECGRIVRIAVRASYA